MSFLMFIKNKLLAKISKIFKNVLIYFAIIDFIKRNIERMVVTNDSRVFLCMICLK